MLKMKKLYDRSMLIRRQGKVVRNKTKAEERKEKWNKYGKAHF